MPKPKSQLDEAVDFAMDEINRVGAIGKLPTAVQIVLRVHAAQGIIDNGGLQYFFEADFPGKPPYSTFVDAYRAIGAKAAAETLARAVELFPFAEPHKHRADRDRYLTRYQDRPHNPFEPFTQVLCGNKLVWELLATFVTKNAKSFLR